MPADSIEKRKLWLEEGIFEHIRDNNGKKDSPDIVSYFKLRADVTLKSLACLVGAGLVERSKKGAYRIKGERK